jgi:hypothetical protein
VKDWEGAAKASPGAHHTVAPPRGRARVLAGTSTAAREQQRPVRAPFALAAVISPGLTESPECGDSTLAPMRPRQSHRPDGVQCYPERRSCKRRAAPPARKPERGSTPARSSHDFQIASTAVRCGSRTVRVVVRAERGRRRRRPRPLPLDACRGHAHRHDGIAPPSGIVIDIARDRDRGKQCARRRRPESRKKFSHFGCRSSFRLGWRKRFGVRTMGRN